MPGECQTRFSFCKEIWKRDNGHSLVLVLKRSGTGSVKTVHKEYGTISLKGCWCNSQKADIKFSALRALCPEVNSKSKGHGKLSIYYAADLETVENFNALSLQTSSVFTEQSRRYVKSLNPFTRERENPL